MTLWLEVTPDEYELPLAVADSVEKLAWLRGKRAGTIKAGVCKWEKGKRKRSIYVRVRVDDED